MEPQSTVLLCDPVTHEGLELIDAQDETGRTIQHLLNTRSGTRYPIRDGIPIFSERENLTGRNRQFRELYDRVAVFYDVQSHIYAFISRQNLRQLREGFLAEIDVRPGDRVLEVSVGTGWNLQLLPQAIEFYGLDLSWGMLQKCRRNLRHWKREACLFCGEAENLPFRDASFDVVFQLGGLNFFNDKAKAIAEMIRIAKPGTKLLISDENEKQVRKLYSRIPILGRRLWNQVEGLGPPVNLIPMEMIDPVVHDHADGRFYTLTFRKPHV